MIMKFDEDLAAIHAYLCADGYVVKNPSTQKHKYYRIGFRNTNLVLLKDFQKRFERIWGEKPRLIEGQRCEKGSKKIYEYLVSNFGSFYSWHWKMPMLNKKLSRVWLRAYFDCEGWVSVETHKSRLIGADCVNSLGLKQVKMTLKALGIKSVIKKKKNGGIFRLYIYGKGNLGKFRELVGFYHPKKSMRLQQAINDYVDYEWKFPDRKDDLDVFIGTLMSQKAKIKSDNGIIRLDSNKKQNLIILKRELESKFLIKCKVNSEVNGIGTCYYQLCVNKKEDVKKIVENKLLNKIEEGKWSRLEK